MAIQSFYSSLRHLKLVHIPETFNDLIKNFIAHAFIYRHILMSQLSELLKLTEVLKYDVPLRNSSLPPGNIMYFFLHPWSKGILVPEDSLGDLGEFASLFVFIKGGLSFLKSRGSSI